MDSNRRDFMKLSAAAAAAAGGGIGAAQAAAPTAPHQRGLATGLTLLQIIQGGQPRLAIKTAAGIVDVAAAAKALNMGAPATMDELLQNEDGPRLVALAKAVAASPQAASLTQPEANVTFAPALSRPEKIVCVGLNYTAHIGEMGDNVPKSPVLFAKYRNALHPHRAPLKLPTAVASKFDYEVELVIIMGKRAQNVSEADALSYVAGYCTGNDFTARDLQYEVGSQWTTGKALDNFAPLGPYLVTADQVNPLSLALECRVNGETRQSSNTDHMIFNCKTLISYISRHITLEPGDIIYTGTPSGVIYGMPKDKQQWLKAGDTVSCSVQGLGELTFTLT